MKVPEACIDIYTCVLDMKFKIFCAGELAIKRKALCLVARKSICMSLTKSLSQKPVSQPDRNLIEISEYLS